MFYIKTRRQLLECMELMRTAPHIRPLILDIAFCNDVPNLRSARGTESIVIDDADFTAFIHSFTHLEAIFCTGFTFVNIPLVLPGSSVTTLDLMERDIQAQELSSIFEAAAPMIRCLMLDTVRVRNPPNAVEMSRLSTITMVALKELALMGYAERLPFYSNIRMPNLEILYCATWRNIFREYLPDSLKTLAIGWDLDGRNQVCRPFDTENFYLRWLVRWETLDQILYLIPKLTIPRNIQHIEIVSETTSDKLPFNMDDLESVDKFESFILDLHQNGSLQKLTFTFEPSYMDIGCGDGLADRFTKLNPLGLVDVRVDLPSVLYNLR
ncbi:hypothetical protein CCMSSC00406_0006034 [Pleurotus cornucopiae]|uniref:Uncharacterized protein n=1 Tax=Pleurotus cornucopiae TaxID=5321 RepID=A0ACB7IN99_PLECO|nr:hypothetical protein CCMSSC00406_0006034 [Pleurotus cornucopiae]